MGASINVALKMLVYHILCLLKAGSIILVAFAQEAGSEIVATNNNSPSSVNICFRIALFLWESMKFRRTYSSLGGSSNDKTTK